MKEYRPDLMQKDTCSKITCVSANLFSFQKPVSREFFRMQNNGAVAFTRITFPFGKISKFWSCRFYLIGEIIDFTTYWLYSWGMNRWLYPLLFSTLTTVLDYRLTEQFSITRWRRIINFFDGENDIIILTFGQLNPT